MTEPQRKDFGDQASLPDPGFDPEVTAPYPDALALPDSGAHQGWPPAPVDQPGAPGTVEDDPEVTSIVDRDWLAEQIGQHGAHHRPEHDPESTSIVDRDWLAEQIDRHPGQLGAPGRFAGPPSAGPPGRPPAPRHEEPRPAPPPAQDWRAAPRPEPARPAPGPQYTDFSAAQGSAATWNYVDNIRSSELVPARKVPPQRGWRKAVFKGSFKLINPGQSPDERYEAELVAKARSLLRGTYRIAVLGKGGVGKSTVAAGLGSIFAELRQDDRVVAVDADAGFGKLAARIDPKVSGSYWEVVNDADLGSFADMRARVGSNAAGLFVLGGAPETARRRILDPGTYRRAMQQLDRHFTLSIIDLGGSTLDTAVTREVLSDVDALIVVSSPWFDGASVAGQTLEWLANGGYTALLHRTVVAIVDSDGHADKSDLKLLGERFGRHGQKVIQLPYDQHLRPGGVIDVQNEINPLTRRRLLELAAECAEHFASTTDRPRGSERR